MIIEPLLNKECLTNNEIEQVQKQKQEYFLLASYLRTKGLKLYSYNSINNEIKEIIVNSSNTITLKPINRQLIAVDEDLEKCTVDPRLIYFEALHYNSAVKRVTNYKLGVIKDLCNLRPFNPDGINFYS